MELDWFLREIVPWLLGGLAVLLGLQFVLGPVFIKPTMKLKAAPRLEVFDPNEKPPPEEIGEYFDYAVCELGPLGFEVVDYVALPDHVPNVSAIFGLLANHATNDLAMIVAMYGFREGLQGRQVAMKNKYVEFDTRFSDGSELSTNNTTEESPFAPVSGRRLVQFLDVASPAVLYRLHERAVEEFGGKSKMPVPPHDDLVRVVRDDIVSEMESQIETGYLKKTPDGRHFVPTWKGAILMTWKLAWPVGAFRRALRKKRGRRLMHQWGIGEQ